MRDGSPLSEWEKHLLDKETRRRAYFMSLEPDPVFIGKGYTLLEKEALRRWLKMKDNSAKDAGDLTVGEVYGCAQGATKTLANNWGPDYIEDRILIVVDILAGMTRRDLNAIRSDCEIESSEAADLELTRIFYLLCEALGAIMHRTEIMPLSSYSKYFLSPNVQDTSQVSKKLVALFGREVFDAMAVVWETQREHDAEAIAQKKKENES